MVSRGNLLPLQSRFRLPHKRVESESAMPQDRGNGSKGVAVTAIAKKGNIGTTQLHDAMIVLRDCFSGAMVGQPTRFKNIKRWSCDARKSPLEIEPTTISDEAPFLNFAPGDEMQLAAVVTLPTDDVYLIEVIILGKRIVAWTRFLPDFLEGLKRSIQDRQNFFVGQWRAVCVLAAGRPVAPK